VTILLCNPQKEKIEVHVHISKLPFYHLKELNSDGLINIFQDKNVPLN